MANASILYDAYCSACKWPVISVVCNDGMSITPPFKDNDYWAYCSNKTCQNHEGKSNNLGDEPEFIVRI